MAVVEEEWAAEAVHPVQVIRLKAQMEVPKVNQNDNTLKEKIEGAEKMSIL